MIKLWRTFRRDSHICSCWGCKQDRQPERRIFTFRQKHQFSARQGGSHAKTVIDRIYAWNDTTGAEIAWYITPWRPRAREVNYLSPEINCRRRIMMWHMVCVVSDLFVYFACERRARSSSISDVTYLTRFVYHRTNKQDTASHRTSMKRTSIPSYGFSGLSLRVITQEANECEELFTNSSTITTPTSSATDQCEHLPYHPMHDWLKECTHLGVFSVKMRPTMQWLCVNSRVAVSEVISLVYCQSIYLGGRIRWMLEDFIP